MSRLFLKFQDYDRNVFMWINGRLHNRFMNFWLYYFTHLGGATSSIAISLLIWLLAPGSMEHNRTPGMYRPCGQPHPCSYREKIVSTHSTLSGLAGYNYVP